MEIDVEYRGNKLYVASEYTYLGLKIHKSGSFLPAIKELRRKAQKAYFQVKAVLKDDNCPQLYTHLFDVLVKPIYCYLAQMYGEDLDTEKTMIQISPANYFLTNYPRLRNCICNAAKIVSGYPSQSVTWAADQN